MKPTSLSDKLARQELIDMVAYQSARRLQKAMTASPKAKREIWLNANEASGAGQYQIDSKLINRYPDFQPEPLLAAYSEYAGLPVQNILATRGADEGIELVIRTFCRAYQDAILICPPTYGMYAISAENHGADIVKVPLVNNQLDLESMAKQVGKVKVVFLCSPGNPTGNLLPLTQVKQALALFKDTAIVVLDEAYIEFSPEHSLTPYLNEQLDEQSNEQMAEPVTEPYPNLVILRTLSKAFALAGLRCGFTLASKDIIQLLSKVIAPYPVPAPVAEIATRALNTHGIKQMTETVSQVCQLRQELIAWLDLQSWCVQVYASDANFVLFKTPIKQLIFNTLSRHGLLIRDQSKQLQLSDCLRISIGSEDEISQLKQILDREIT